MSDRQQRIKWDIALKRAAQIHQKVCNFLNMPQMKKRLQQLNDNLSENEKTFLKILLNNKDPLTSPQIREKRLTKSVSRISEIAKELITDLEEWSKSFDLFKKDNVVITIPRKVGGLKVGYYLTCQNVNTHKELDTSHISKLLDTSRSKRKQSDTHTDQLRIERQLRSKLRVEAKSGLAEKLHQRNCNDYKARSMEVGFTSTKVKKVKSDLKTDTQSVNPEDHNRSWKDFDYEKLLSPKDVYVISSSTGTGKTTFLRYLQLRILEHNQFMPILLHADHLKGFNLCDTNSFLTHLADLLKFGRQKKPLLMYLKDCFKRMQIILLVDGLDQIEGSGTDKRNVFEWLLRLFNQNLVVSSRPFAVISQEQNPKVTFLRLKPFSIEAQMDYFGKLYDRASQICCSCRELLGIPMLAYMVRMLIEKKQDENIRNRSDIYKRFLDYVLKPETGYRHDRLQSDVDISHDVRQALGEISYEALCNEEPHIQKIPLNICRPYVKNHGTTTVQLLQHGLPTLIADRSQGLDEFLYFTHQSFQEYLAAEWAAINKERVDLMLNEMWNPKWKEVIKFLSGILKEDFVDKIYPTQCKDNCIHSRLFLAAECCGEVGITTPTEIRVYDKLSGLIVSSPFEQNVFDALSKLNTSEAIEELVGYIPFANRLLGNIPEFMILRQVLCNISHRLQSSHINQIFSFFLFIPEDKRFQVIDILSTFSERLIPEHIDKLVDLTIEIASPLSGHICDVYRSCLLLLTDSVLKEETLEYCSIKLNRLLQSDHELENRLALDVLKANRSDLEISNDHINLVLGFIEKPHTDADPTQRSKMASEVLTGLAKTGKLKDEHIQRLLGLLGDKNTCLFAAKPLFMLKLDQRQKNCLVESLESIVTNDLVRLIENIATEVNDQMDVVLHLLKKWFNSQNIDIQTKSIDVISQLGDRISNQDIERICDFATCLKLLNIPDVYASSFEMKKLIKLHQGLQKKPIKNRPIKFFEKIHKLIRYSSAKHLTQEGITETIEQITSSKNQYVFFYALAVLECQRNADLTPHMDKIISFLASDNSMVVYWASTILAQHPDLSDANISRIIEVLRSLKISNLSVVNKSLFPKLTRIKCLPRPSEWFKNNNAEQHQSTVFLLRRIAYCFEDDERSQIIECITRFSTSHNVIDLLKDMKELPLSSYTRLLDYLGNMEADIDRWDTYDLYSFLRVRKPFDLDQQCHSEVDTAFCNLECFDQDSRRRSIYYLSLISDTLNPQQMGNLLRACVNEINDMDGMELRGVAGIDVYPNDKNRSVKNIEFLLGRLCDNRMNDNKRSLCIRMLECFSSHLEVKYIKRIKLALDDLSYYVREIALRLLNKIYSEGRLLY